MKWEIEPCNSVGPIRLGAPRSEVRGRLGSEFEIFLKGRNPVDAYDSLGVHIYYDNEDRVEMVEAFEPAAVTLNESKLIGRNYEEVQDDLQKFGLCASPTDVGFLFRAIGVALTLGGSVVEGVAIARSEYFDHFV